MLDSPELQPRNHEQQPIQAYFLVTKVPAGEEPLWVKEQNVGLCMPLRYDQSESPCSFTGYAQLTDEALLTTDGVMVVFPDVLDSLRSAGRDDVVGWLVENSIRDEYKGLIFNRLEGRIISKAAKERFYPD